MSKPLTPDDWTPVEAVMALVADFNHGPALVTGGGLDPYPIMERVAYFFQRNGIDGREVRLEAMECAVPFGSEPR